MKKVISISNENFKVASPALLLIKLAVLIGIGYLIIVRVYQYDQLSDISGYFIAQWHNGSGWHLGACCLLLFVNWGAEVAKWRLLTQKIDHKSWWSYTKEVMAGISLGIITPARIGEYGGRVLYYKEDKLSLGLQANFLSSISQNMVNISFGIIGGLYFISNYTDWGEGIKWSIMTFGLSLVVVLWLFYAFFDRLLPIISNMLPDKWTKFIPNVLPVSPDQQHEVVLLSVFRYFVFVSQYILLLHFFGIEGGLISLLSAVSFIYLIQSGIPLPAFLSVLARGEVALLVMAPFTYNPISVVAATFSLWIVNLLIPAFVGSVLIMNR